MNGELARNGNHGVSPTGDMVVALENEQREEHDALHRLDPAPADLVPRCRRLQRFFFDHRPATWSIQLPESDLPRAGSTERHESDCPAKDEVG